MPTFNIKSLRLVSNVQSAIPLAVTSTANIVLPSSSLGAWGFISLLGPCPCIILTVKAMLHLVCNVQHIRKMPYAALLTANTAFLACNWGRISLATKVTLMYACV